MLAVGVLLGVMAFLAAGAALAAQTGEVKETSEPRPCGECGKPTWSSSGLCAVCGSSNPRTETDAAQQEAEPGPRMPELDAEGKVAEDVHCRHCGYNLRGLAPTGICPECKMLVARSLFGDRLRFSDPAWVQRLDNGVRLLLGAIFASIIGGILGFIAMMIYMATTGGAMPPITVVGIFTALMTLITFVWVAAVWILTTPDPGGMETERPVSARSLARWCIMASLASVPIGTLQQQWMAAPGATPAMTTLDALLITTGALLGLVAVIGTAAGIVYLHSLALRIPSTGLAQQTKIAGWGYVIVMVFGQVTGSLYLIIFGGAMAAGAFSPWMVAFTVSNCFFTLGALVFGIWMIVLLIRYAGAFRRARKGAERFAAAAQGLPLAA